MSLKLQFPHSDFMYQYLIHVDKGFELREQLDEVENLVATKYEGSRLFKDIFVMVGNS